MYLGFMSAFWHYMTPHYPKPSAHEVITGFFVPNTVDLDNSATISFGTTIDIMAMDSADGTTSECMSFEFESQSAL